MAKSKSTKGVKVAKSVNSSTKREVTNKPKSKRVSGEPVGDPPCNCCAELFTGKPSGTMVAAEDDGCRDIPPPQGGAGPWFPFWPTQGNQGFPYWESIANIAADVEVQAIVDAKVQAIVDVRLEQLRSEILMEMDARIAAAIQANCGQAMAKVETPPPPAETC